MSQAPEPQPLERPELKVIRPDDRASLAEDSLPAPDRLEQTERSSGSAAGVEQRERVVSDRAGVVHSERTVHDVAGERRLGLARATQLIWLLFGIVEVLIGLRVLLKLIGANPSNDFASFIYNASGFFVGPFLTLTGSPAAGGVVLEIASIVAMLIYLLLGWVVLRIVRVLWPSRSTTSSDSTYDRYQS